MPGLEKALRGSLRRDVPMAKYCTFRIGGKADLFFVPEDAEDLKSGLLYAREKKIPWFILGNGSNILVSDEGMRAMVIHLEAPAFRKLSFEGSILTVGAGVKTGTVLRETVNRGLGGIEFLGSIPATMGGIFFMNGGTYLGEIADVLKEARVLDERIQERVVLKDEMDFHYRKSVFQKKPWVILEGSLALVPMMKKEAQGKVSEILERRRKTQPLKLPSAGSAFTNPPGRSAWRLIEEAGLRNFSIGDAAVSDIHANFVINKGEAKASEIFELMRVIQEKVVQKSGILLEPEIRLVGEWKEDFLRKA